jgi:hypothetical protein
MSTVGSFDRSKHFSELADPIDRGSGLVSPASRRQEALRNLANSTTFTLAQLAFVDNVTAGTAAASKALVLDANMGIASFRNLSSPRIIKQAAPAAKTTSVTLTAAELIGGLITGNQGAAGAAAYTLPLATDLETALIAIYPGLQNDDAFDFTVINISTVAAEDITMTTNTGWTLVGEMVVPSNDTAGVAPSNGVFRARRTAANTYTLYRVG